MISYHDFRQGYVRCLKELPQRFGTDLEMLFCDSFLCFHSLFIFLEISDLEEKFKEYCTDTEFKIYERNKESCLDVSGFLPEGQFDIEKFQENFVEAVKNAHMNIYFITTDFMVTSYWIFMFLEDKEFVYDYWVSASFLDLMALNKVFFNCIRIAKLS